MPFEGITHDDSLPSNIEAEQGVLAAILLNNAAHASVAEFLKPEHFSNAGLGRLYHGAARLIERGVVANAITLRNMFDDDPAFAEYGAGRYLAELVANAVTIIGAEGYGRIIVDCWRRRELIAVADTLRQQAKRVDLDQPTDDIITATSGALDALQVQEAADGGGSLRNAADTALASLEAAQRAYQQPGTLAGISTGIGALDDKMGGLVATDLTVAGGPPGSGKTNFGCTLALNAARDGEGVAFFSGEMPADQIAQRFLARLSGVSAHNQRRGNIDRDGWESLIAAQGVLRAMPVHIDDRPLSLSRIRGTVRDLRRRKHPVSLVIADYLQLIDADQANMTRFDRVTAVAVGLKKLAKQLGVAVVALAQMNNRNIEARDDKRPMLSDLRDSGEIENAADTILLIHRAEPYLVRAEPAQRMDEDPMRFDKRHSEWSMALAASRGAAEIIIAKARHGPIGVARIGFDAQRSCFTADKGEHWNAAGEHHYTETTGDMFR